MGRTIGRFKPPGSPQHDFEAECDICGVVWPRSKLRMDGEGNLVCPDEGRGLDAATLNEMNARAVERLNQPYASMVGRPRGPTTPFYESPTSILGSQASSGWWPWDIGLRTTPNQVNWPNQVIARGIRGDGELLAFGDDIPTKGASGLVFADHATGLLANRGKWISVGQDEVKIWVVADLEEETADSQELFSIRAIGSGGSMIAGVSLGRFRSDVSSGAVFGVAKFAAADVGLTFSAPRPASGQHVYQVTVTPELCTLTIDDDAYTAAPVYQGGFQVPCNQLRMGYRGVGTYSEAAVST